ncbi:DNA mismatch repair protein MutT [Paenibacillus baekrokdamisoli]|uniref:DNA mismatch repair protein MutT n=1 Tax=Paenibacillus baekrokdamisoli TaxID=1712516 RepID=A0A3G9JN02_9BACL|nr:NUDIX domain-containing protein [Paenibacillus baekrokdamisoli]MBB3072861.1 ADP-ribose pyrophosphatase YjhB (NUDIX family) [Paenibacillus baekrokdamisoli]BBH24419.1 DNA mismatch repair protein MutT [Paenibacillus baekrokdamisoli]
MGSEKKQKYHVLARGIILSEDHILVAHCLGMDNTFLPGGHVEFREGIRTSLSREILEELGLESEVKEYLGIVEAEFDLEEVYHQEINHLFKTEIQELNYTINPVSQESHLEFYWIHIDEMEVHNLQPYPVRKVIKDYINHVSGAYFESTFERVK